MEKQSSGADAAGPRAGGDARAVFAGVAAIAGVLAASSCCLPLLPFALAAGIASGSTFLAAARPYLLGVSVLLIAYGFFQTRRARTCHRRPGIVSFVLLWVSTGFVFVAIFFPQVMANAAAGLLAR